MFYIIYDVASSNYLHFYNFYGSQQKMSFFAHNKLSDSIFT